jgi:hypothetical protein
MTIAAEKKQDLWDRAAEMRPPPGVTGPPQPLWGGAANFLEVYGPQGNLTQRISAWNRGAG